MPASSFENNTQVFIIRIWLERREMDCAAPVWRGVIEHMPSGERHYMKDLDDIMIFAMPFLEGIGIKPTLFWQVKRGLNRLRLALTKQKL